MVKEGLALKPFLGKREASDGLELPGSVDLSKTVENDEALSNGSYPQGCVSVK